MDAPEQISQFKDFFETQYQKEIAKAIQEEKNAITIDFTQVIIQKPELAEALLEDPENTIKAAELALDELALEKQVIRRVRFRNLPPTEKLRIADIRSLHLDRFIALDGIVRQASEVRPQVTNAKFECPSCGNTISILQLEARFKEPSRCSCGRRGKFRLLQKELVDAQHLKIKQPP